MRSRRRARDEEARRMRRFLLGVRPLVVSLALIAAACGGGDDGETAAGEGAVAGAGATSIEIALTDFAIDPGDIQVAAGVPLTFHVMNEGPAPHTFGVTVGDQTYETAT